MDLVPAFEAVSESASLSNLRVQLLAVNPEPPLSGDQLTGCLSIIPPAGLTAKEGTRKIYDGAFVYVEATVELPVNLPPNVTFQVYGIALLSMGPKEGLCGFNTFDNPIMVGPSVERITFDLTLFAQKAPVS